ncbi:MAG: protein kinase [Planctomycetes bacterium]|nr:protein kinase [Planctomycetota bacterium]
MTSPDETAPLPPPGAPNDTVLLPGQGAPASPPTDGKSLGRYRVVRELGKGGMGAVYEAHDPVLRRRVAIKVLLGDDAPPEAVERFRIEARAVARLTHPHIVGLHDVDEADGRPFLVMELVEGESLAAKLRRDGPLAPEEAARLAQRLADALAYAHARAILHRDVKPANVLLDRAGEPRLGDFGLAKELEKAGSGPTEVGAVMGTPAYMAPEVVKGELERVDRRADVYALGATLFELLTGRPPFTGASIPVVLAAVLRRDPPRPSSLRPGLDRDLETITLRCLEKEPERRYASAGELALDLGRWLAHEPIAARPPGLVERLGKWRRRNRAVARTLAATSLVALALMTAGAVGFVRRLDEERRRSEAAAREAREALDALVYQVRDRLGDLPGERLREVRRELLALAAERLARLDDLAGDRAPSHDLAEAYQQLADLAQEAGDARRAAEAASQAVATARALVARDGGARASRFLLAECLRASGYLLLLQNELPAAAAALEETTRLLAGDAARGDGEAAARQVDALVLLGRVQREAGDLEASLGSGRTGLALSQALLVGRPGEPELQKLEALALEHVAHVQMFTGEVAAAVEGFAAVAARLESLLDRAPESVAVRRNLLDVSLALGFAEAARGRLSGAARAFERAAALAGALRTQDPSSLRSALAHAAAHQGLARARGDAGEVARAREAQAEAVAALRGVVALDPDAVSPRQELADALDGLARLALKQGEADAAGGAITEAVDLCRALVDRPGPTDQARASLACALLLEGELLQRRGALPEALARFAEAVEVERARVARDPGNQRARTALAAALVGLGHARADHDLPDAADAAFAEGLDLLRAHTQGDAADLEPIRMLAEALERRSDLRRATGDADAALAALDEALPLRRRVAAGEVGRRGLAGCQGRRGRLLLAAGALDEALAAYEEAGALVEALAAQDPTDAEAARDRRRLASALGDVQQARGDLAAARATFERALGLQRDALAASPDDPEARRDLVVAHVKLAEVQRAAKDLAGCVATYEEAVALSRALAAEVGSALHHEDLAANLLRLGDAERLLGRLDRAEGVYVEAQDQARARLAATPDSARVRRDLHVALLRLGELAFRRDDLGRAGPLLTEATDLARAAVASDPDAPGARRDLSFVLLRLADVRQAEERTADALTLLQEMLANHERLAALRPAHGAELDRLRPMVAGAARAEALRTGERAPTTPDEHLVRAEALARAGRHREALAHFRPALVGRAPGDPAIAAARSAALAGAERDVLLEAVAWLAPAVRALREALAVGDEGDARRAPLEARLRALERDDPDFAPLRDLPAFEALFR